MSNDIQLFNFNNNDIRVIAEEDGSIWFVARDVAKSLGYSHAQHAINRHCRDSGVKHSIVSDTVGRGRRTKIIDEANVYRLVSGSRLPEAKKFDDWLYSEVLPSIRKTGGYSVSEDPDRVAFRASLFEPRDRVVFLVREIDRLQGELDSLIKGE